MSPAPEPPLPPPVRPRLAALRGRLDAALAGPLRGLGLLRLTSGEAPLDLRIAGRLLLHSGLVGLVAGGLGVAFFASLELLDRLLLVQLAGFTPLPTGGAEPAPGGSPRLWLLALLPAAGALASGVLTAWLAPEAAGGGGDAAIEAYHHGGLVRRRVIPVKWLAAVLALSSGGSGGREGPTMQIGAAVGAAVARLLPTSRAERRILLVAGIAAGISAVFRTPLGAALLATELLYRDDFEAEALVPSVFASVVAYSVAIAAFGESRLFAHLPAFPFTPAHLPLYAASAVVVSAAGALFVTVLRGVQAGSARLVRRTWLRPAAGGLCMGLLGVALLLWVEHHHGPAAAGFGVFGGGYGVLEVALAGAPWLAPGWLAAGLLLAVALLKLVASALTVGTGAAAGDFAPSLVIGGLTGAACGMAARLLTGDPRLQPAAFALVGMCTFYGGLARAPLAALVLVSELAGSYDLLVPMMLSIGIAYVALRRTSLYPAQRPSRAAGPAAPEGELLRALGRSPARAACVAPELPPLDARATLAEAARLAAGARQQRVALVFGAGGARGLLELALLGEVPEAERAEMLAADGMVPFAALPAGATWSDVAELLERTGVSQVPLLDEAGAVAGWVGDRELRRALAGRRGPDAGPPALPSG